MIWLYLHPGWVLVGVVAASAATAYAFAGEMSQAARRFRHLNTTVTETAVDKLRNDRWHTFGFWLRFAVAGVIGLAAGQMVTQFPARLITTWALAWLVSGTVISLCFDPIFNLKIGVKFFYIGTTSKVDRTVALIGREDHSEQERLVWMTIAKAGLVMVACVLWMFLV